MKRNMLAVLAVVTLLTAMAFGLGCAQSASDSGGDSTIVYVTPAPTSTTPEPQGCADTDDDGICDNVDNCWQKYNPNQADSDHNGIGDACETSPTPNPNPTPNPQPNPPPTCTAGDADQDGICDDVDPCIDIDDNGVCDDQECMPHTVVVCYNPADNPGQWVTIAYGNPNLPTQWEQQHDHPLSASGCATFEVEYWYPGYEGGSYWPIDFGYADCTRRTVSQYPADPQWCGDAVVPTSIKVDGVSHTYSTGSYVGPGSDGLCTGGCGFPFAIPTDCD